MSRPFPETFDGDSQMKSPQSATSNISYSTNVNRQKTKKWAEAAPVDYGGGWGDDDEYDPSPMPSSSTGVRQQGQTIHNTATSPTDYSKKYGDLPALPGANVSRARANSFDEDDETRNFSNSTIRQASAPDPRPSANAPPTRFSQITGLPTVRNPSGPPALSVNTAQPQPPSPAGQRKTVAAQVISPVPESPNPDVLQTGRVNTGGNNPIFPQSETRIPSTMTSDYEARRDYSPTAVPAPLSTRASPASQPATDPVPTRYPARKSSLSQITRPEEIETAQKPWTQDLAPSPGASALSPTSPSAVKALPFIRPADIYKRSQEERLEKERQSIESGRPSMESISGAKSSVRSESPANSTAGVLRTSLEAQDPTRRPGSHLASVQERQSEYGFEGFNANDSSARQASYDPATALKPGAKLESERKMSTSPELPVLNRISGFGMDMFSQPPTTESSSSKDLDTTPTTLSRANFGSPNTEHPALRNQPSLGFKSAVKQAFDRTDDRSLPNTPASRTGSQVRRSDSESTGTAGISPIISRMPSTANPATRNPELTTPSIPETVNEPISPANGSARTPDVLTPTSVSNPQHTVASDTVPDAEMAQPVRPAVNRDESFRPQLPGGWISYTGTEASEASTEPLQTLRQVTPSPQPQVEDRDVTPTAKHPLPKTALEATAMGAVVLGAGAVAERQHSPTQIEGSNVDAKLQHLPPLEKASEETQLRPDAVHRPISEAYDAPLPPPKDAPRIGTSSKQPEYFPQSNVPVIQTTSESPEDPIAHDNHSRAGILPVLNTGEDEYEQENDKLSEDIVRSLSPRGSDTKRESVLPDPNEGDFGGQGRESTYLPSEYDNYWASTAEENPSAIPAVENPLHVVNTPLASTASVPTVTEPDSTLSPHPLTPRKVEDGGSSVAGRPTLQNRFSWEKSSDNFAEVQPVPLLGIGSGSGNTTHESQYARSTLAESTPLSQQSNLPEPVVAKSSYAPPQADQSEMEVHISEPSSAAAEGHHDFRDAATAAGVAAAGGGVAAATYHHQAEPSRRLSLAEEKSPKVSSYAVSQEPLESEHPVHSPQPYFSPESQPTVPAPPSTVSPIATPVLATAAPAATQPRFTPFRTIAAMSSPQERIHTYNDVRGQYASIDSGLNGWITTLQSQFPEHAGATGIWGPSHQTFPAGSASSRHKVSGSAPPLQQPYYQQYLNASSPSTPTARPGPGFGTSPGSMQPNFTSQGFSTSPSTSKLTTQQVQAKGKELLQGASIFGGKAGKAGKGLLAKGKNKLRGAGGGDKESTESTSIEPHTRDVSTPPAKSKTDRRSSSWGLPAFAKSKNTLATDASTVSSEIHIPDIERNPTGGNITSGPIGATVVPGQQQWPPQQDYTSSPAPASATTSTPAPTVSTVRQVEQDREVRGEGNDLAGPKPLSKFQPSWDPHGSPPITEEGESTSTFAPLGSHALSQAHAKNSSEVPRTQGKTSLESAPRGSLSVPADTRSPRSSGEDAPFFDAREDVREEATTPEMERDWVMVDPAIVDGAMPASSQASTTPVTNTKPSVEPIVSTREVSEVSEVEEEEEEEEEEQEKQEKEEPVTSILNRPRGSSYGIPLSPARTAEATTSKSRDLSAKPRVVSTPASSTPAFQSLGLYNAPATQTQVMPQRQSAPPAPHQESERSSFLPPIRRTSTFGLGFGSRTKKERFPIDDDEDEDEMPGGVPTGEPVTASGQREEVYMPPPGPPPQHLQQQQPSQQPSQVEARGPPQQQQSPAVLSRAPQQQVPVSYQPAPPQATPPVNQPTQKRQSFNFFKTRAPLEQSRQSESQQLPQERSSHPPPVFIPQGGQQNLQHPEYTQSHVEWKTDRAKQQRPPAVASPSQSSQSSASYWKEQDIPPPRLSWDQTQRQTSSMPPQQQERPPFIQPPSSAQRYPELFKTGQSQHTIPDEGNNKETEELPEHMYQAPLSRNQAFLPRQQGNEYQIPGVGPPAPDSMKRNSGLWKEIGGKLSRASSRERRNSLSREGRPESGTADSVATTEDGRGDRTQKRRSSFFGGLNRASTGGLESRSGLSRESTVAHFPGSRTDLVSASAERERQPSPLSQHERRRSFFGGAGANQSPGKLSRASTAGLSPSPSEERRESVGKEKKKRGSFLSGFMGGRTTPQQIPNAPQQQQQPPAVRQLAHNERQPLDSPGEINGLNAHPHQARKPSMEYNGPRHSFRSERTQQQSQRQPTRVAQQAGIEGAVGGPARLVQQEHQMGANTPNDQRQASPPASVGPPGGPSRLVQQVEIEGTIGGPARVIQQQRQTGTSSPVDQHPPTLSATAGPPGGPVRLMQQQRQMSASNPGNSMSTHQSSHSLATIGPPGGPARLNQQHPNFQQQIMGAGADRVGNGTREVYEPPEGPPPSHLAKQRLESSSPAVPSQSQTRSQAHGQKFNDPTATRGITMGQTPPPVRQVSNTTPAGYTGTSQGPRYNNSSSQLPYATDALATPQTNVERQVQKTSPLSQRVPQPGPRGVSNVPSNQQYTPPAPAFQQQRNSPSPAQTMRQSQLDGRQDSMGSNLDKQRQSSISRNVLSKLSGSGSDSNLPESKPPKERKERSSFMVGLLKRKDKDDRVGEESRSMGNAHRGPVNQNQGVPQQFAPQTQTYMDSAQREHYAQHQQQQPLQSFPQQQQQQQQFPPQFNPSSQPQPGLLGQPPQDRERTVSREPQYDQVPIPGGYQLVRGQGNIPVNTEYDPRGLTRLHQQQIQTQSDPRYQQSLLGQVQQPNLSQSNPLQPRQQSFDSQQGTQAVQAWSNTNLATPETYVQGRDGVPRRLSREDMLARSPPKSPEGQQRPYELTLPASSIPSSQSHQKPLKLDTIQRLQNPTLRHPESPAGYPLPEDDVFSPVNEAARDYPPPPPPKGTWPSGQHERQASISTADTNDGGLDRSNTHRTAISAISRLSNPADSPRQSSGVASGNGGLNVPRGPGPSVEGQKIGSHSSPSPTPPSPLIGTPRRDVSPEREADQEPQVKTTILDRHPRQNPGGEDLYDASPRLPQVPTRESMSPISNLPESSASALDNGNGNAGSRRSVEEKIVAPRSTQGLVELENVEPGSTMSATSYPGQEWNPYGRGWVDDE